eukprot:743286-Pyramimonas_sp.AAC.1
MGEGQRRATTERGRWGRDGARKDEGGGGATMEEKGGGGNVRVEEGSPIIFQIPSSSSLLSPSAIRPLLPPTPLPSSLPSSLPLSSHPSSSLFSPLSSLPPPSFTVVGSFATSAVSSQVARQLQAAHPLGHAAEVVGAQSLRGLAALLPAASECPRLLVANDAILVAPRVLGVRAHLGAATVRGRRSGARAM